MTTALTALITKEPGLEAGSRSRQTPRVCVLVNNKQMTGQPLQSLQFGRNAETPKGVGALRCGGDPVACLGPQCGSWGLWIVYESVYSNGAAAKRGPAPVGSWKYQRRGWFARFSAAMYPNEPVDNSKRGAYQAMSCRAW